jgi:RNA polymerase sigma-70 factor (ECF subfamily)
MSEKSSDSLQALIVRLQHGEKAARDELLARTYSRLRQLMGKMIRRFPAVQDQAGPTDVLHETFFRLSRALEALSPKSVDEFFRLAALNMRRQLLDMARKCRRRPEGHQVSLPEPSPGCEDDAAAEPSQSTLDPAALERWCEFHRQVEMLPEEERSVFDLLYYHDLSQAEAAELLGVSVPTIKRRWAAARMRLATYLIDRSV